MGEPIICNFELASFTDEVHNRSADLRNAGTIYYKAPELFSILNHNITQESDIWAFGILSLEVWSVVLTYHIINLNNLDS